MGTQDQDERIIALRESIRASFPAETYAGQLTSHDGAWTPDLDEEQALYEELNGRKWTDVPTQLIRDLPDGYVLLTDEAFLTFLPAWLMYSLDELGGDNEVREFLVYSFSPSPDLLPDMTWLKRKRLRLLNPEQRLTLRSLLAQFAEWVRSPLVKALATKSVGMIDALDEEAS